MVDRAVRGSFQPARRWERAAGLVVGGQSVVGDLGAESLGEEAGGGVEVGHGDAEVLDAAGRWCGIAQHRGGVDRMLPVSALRTAFGPWIGAPAADAAQRPQAAVDEVYEGALRMTLQVIAVPSGARR